MPVKQGKPLLPPEPSLWKKYSPRHEFPLSSAASVTLHVVVIVLLVLGAMYVFNTDHDKPLAVAAVVVAGGGGDPGGTGDGPGEGTTNPTENVDPMTQPSKDAPPNIPREGLKEAIADPIDIGQFTDDTGRIIDDAPAEVEKLTKLSDDVRKKLFRGVAAGAGQGGPGRDGGKDSGKDKGVGKASGDGKERGTIRQKRVLRWTLVFSTVNGEDYRRQLKALGAILAIPDGAGGYLVLRELERNAQPQREDLDKIQRIFWVDDRPESVTGLAQALGLRDIPAHVVAFFPESLEAELLDKELRFRNMKEENIKETRFKVVKSGARYVPMVESQR
jgi:hypothetical protein